VVVGAHDRAGNELNHRLCFPSLPRFEPDAKSSRRCSAVAVMFAVTSSSAVNLAKAVAQFQRAQERILFAARVAQKRP